MLEHLAALNLDRRICIDDRGFVLRVVEMFDEYGEHTDEISAALKFIAGPDERGRYWAGCVCDFEKMVLH